VTVAGVLSGLGHGLDESAVRAAQGTRFDPALDASGRPVDWKGTVKIVFQLAQ
jgi:protein TonB